MSDADQRAALVEAVRAQCATGFYQMPNDDRPYATKAIQIVHAIEDLMLSDESIDRAFAAYKDFPAGVVGPDSWRESIRRAVAGAIGVAMTEADTSSRKGT